MLDGEDRIKFPRQAFFEASELFMMPAQPRWRPMVWLWAILLGWVGVPTPASACEVACCCSTIDENANACPCDAAAPQTTIRTPDSTSPATRSTPSADSSRAHCGCRIAPTAPAPVPPKPSPTRDRSEQRSSPDRWLSRGVSIAFRLRSLIAASRFEHHGPPPFLFESTSLHLWVSCLLF